MLFACGREPNPLETELATARQLLAAENFAPLLSQADRWIERADASGDLRRRWQFRLVKAEALLGRRESLDAAVVLKSLGEMPSGDLWARDRAKWYILRAEAAYHLSQYHDIPDLLSKAQEEASKAKAPDLSIVIEMRRGALLTNEGNVGDAHRIYSQALALAAGIHDRGLEAKIHSNVGILLLAESRYDEAIPELERSRSMALEIGTPDTAARAQGNLGICYFRLGDYDNARDRLAAAQSEFAQTGNLYEVQIWTGNAGNLYYSAGDFATAREHYSRALAIARKLDARIWVGRWLSNLASVSIEQRDWNAAERYNNEARAVKSRTNDFAYEASSFVNAAKIADGRGESENSRILFQKALHRAAEDPTVVLDAHAGLAGVYARTGSMGEAEAEFRNTIAEIDRRQSKLSKTDYRLSWLDSLIGFYQNYVDFLMSRDQPEKALEAAESSRSKVLTGDLAGQSAPTDLRRLSRQTNSTLLEYWLGTARSYLWVVTPTKIFCHILPPKNRLLPLIRTYRAVITGGRNPLDVAPDTGLKLYNELLAPAMRDAGSGSRFIIVPDDELYSLNFETLPDADNPAEFWIERATVRISPSLNYLASNALAANALEANAPRRHSEAPKHLLLIGDPVSTLPQYPKLEFASQEISSIAATMSAAQPVVVTGSAATPDSYAASGPGKFAFIHFSAHAAAPAKRASALDSAVILSGPSDRCRLAARTVASIPLNAELVTVSACRSAGGKTYGGEGLVGFAWAFMKAGAGNVIAGLWDVNDRSTLQLMSVLYTRIAAGMPPADALRASKLALIHGGGSYAKPFYWAPFQIYTARAN
ncbi:MAG TPA: CHAT domain-containing tetratricopeptide repeat protein [Bryobacteraceae bacterium]|nr:CHAT domain-containing tetratricopeptide repeat protein [Bryobacteraceae bacterium]